MGEKHFGAQADPGQLRRFTQRVIDNLKSLEGLIEGGSIERGVRRIGAEQELFLVDQQWEPAAAVDLLLDELGDEHFTCELGRFNLEINLDPLELNGKCFGRLHTDLEALVGRVRSAAARHKLAVVMTGILPTLRLEHLTSDYMTSRSRYEVLDKETRHRRGEDFSIQIRGLDELQLEHANVMLEACNTSFQVHYQVSAAEFPLIYNVAQAIAGPVLSLAANSPLLFGHRLWAETRIPLFQQSLDTRTTASPARRGLPRVTFGRRWIDESVLEIFREDIGRFPVMLAVEDCSDEGDTGQPLELKALRAHNGTVYRWNRPCYGVTEGVAHLRIENRYLPSGPTMADEIANAAIWCGLLAGVAAEYPRIHEEMAFDQARQNFARGARDGLSAQFEWMDRTNVPAERLIRSRLLPLAREGLVELGIDRDDIDLYLGIIDDRTATNSNGARWVVGSLGSAPPGPAELASLTAAMHQNQWGGDPVAQWPLVAAEAPPAGDTTLKVRDVMTRDPFVVGGEQVIDLAVSLMDWRQIRHVPVEDSDHRLIGLVTYRSLLRILLEGARTQETAIPIRKVMIADVVTVSPDTKLFDALELMEEKHVGCLPVVENERLIGILSERDFMEVAKLALEDSAEPSVAEGDLR